MGNLDKYSKDLIGFYEYLTDQKPITPQIALLIDIEQRKRRILNHFCRGSGKTQMWAVVSLWFAIFYKWDVVVLGGKMDQAKKVLGYIKRFKREGKLEGIIKFITQTKVELIDGPTIECLYTSAQSVHGPHAQLLIIDEAAYVKTDGLIKDALEIPKPFGKNSMTIISSTPNSETECLFNEWLRDPSKHKFVVHSCTQLDCPWILKEDIELSKLEYGPARFQTEVMGKLAGIGDMPFYPIKDINLCRLAANEKMLIGNGYKTMGIDPGEAQSSFTVSIIENEGEFRKIIQRKIWKPKKRKEVRDKQIEEIMDWIEKRVKDPNDHISKIYIDNEPASYQRDLRNMGFAVTPIDFKRQREHLEANARRKLLRHQIKFPNTTQLDGDALRQWRDYRGVKHRPRDIIDADMLALWEIKKNVKRGSALGFGKTPLSEIITIRKRKIGKKKKDPDIA